MKLISKVKMKEHPFKNEFRNRSNITLKNTLLVIIAVVLLLSIVQIIKKIGTNTLDMLGVYILIFITLFIPALIFLFNKLAKNSPALLSNLLSILLFLVTVLLAFKVVDPSIWGCLLAPAFLTSLFVDSYIQKYISLLSFIALIVYVVVVYDKFGIARGKDTIIAFF